MAETIRVLKSQVNQPPQNHLHFTKNRPIINNVHQKHAIERDFSMKKIGLALAITAVSASLQAMSTVSIKAVYVADQWPELKNYVEGHSTKLDWANEYGIIVSSSTDRPMGIISLTQGQQENWRNLKKRADGETALPATLTFLSSFTAGIAKFYNYPQACLAGLLGIPIFGCWWLYRWYTTQKVRTVASEVVSALDEALAG